MSNHPSARLIFISLSIAALSAFLPGKSPLAEDIKSSISSNYMHFTRACEAGDEVVLAAVGDVLVHHELQIQAWKDPARFASLWGNVSDLIAAADIAYANLEGPTARGISRKGTKVKDPGEAFDDVVYTGYPKFNYHPALVEDLAKSGFDVLSTANNHSLDRGALGADLTIDALNANKLPFTGTRPTTNKKHPWFAITESKGFKIAWLACAENTNGIPDTEGQVLNCYDHQPEIERLIRKDLSAAKGVDAVIITPHWGSEYQHKPTKQQQEFAHAMVDAGAAAVIGNHPHVIQPWEKYATGGGREALIMYSIGNFVSHQPELSKRSTVLLYVGLKRSAVDGVVFVSGARYVPMHTRHDAGRDFYFTEAIDRVGGFDDARALITALMGESNVLTPGDPLDMAPHCGVSEAAP